MLLFYIIVSVFSAVGLILDFSLNYIFKIKSFGIDKTKIGGVFYRNEIPESKLVKKVKKKSYLVPFYKFFPENIVQLIFQLWAGSMFGVFLSLRDENVFFTLILSLLFAFFCVFILRYIVFGIIDTFKKNTPKTFTIAECEEIEGLEGYVILPTDGENVGKVRFEFAGKEFEKNAVSIFKTPLAEFERVVIIYSANDCLFVEGITQIHGELID